MSDTEPIIMFLLRPLLLFCFGILGAQHAAEAFLLAGPAVAGRRTLCFSNHEGARIPSTCNTMAKISSLCMGPRYGPTDNERGYGSVSEGKDSSVPAVTDKNERYRVLLDSILAVKDPQHIPSLLAKNMDVLLLALTSESGGAAALRQSVLDEAKSRGDDDQRVARLEEVIELTLAFAEEFVQQASKIDAQNKNLLGKIIKIMSEKETSSKDREEWLDELLTAEREHLTAGFLRHIEGECDRIAGAPKMTPESARLLETLRIIQARVVEELGQDLGEAAQVLGQLIGYESAPERKAVLDAGLTVRGVSFAYDLKALTQEALDGFQRVPRGADPELVKIVQEIDDNLREYLGENSKFE